MSTSDLSCAERPNGDSCNDSVLTVVEVGGKGNTAESYEMDKKIGRWNPWGK